MINCILFFGGFDSQCNFKDAKLLSLYTMKWYNLEYSQSSDTEHIIQQLQIYTLNRNNDRNSDRNRDRDRLKI